MGAQQRLRALRPGRIPAAVVQAYRDAGDGTTPAPQAATAPLPPVASPFAQPAEEPTTEPSETADADVLAWHEAKGYKIPADGTVNGLMRHRYRAAH